MGEDERIDKLKEAALDKCPFLKASLRRRTGIPRIDQNERVKKYSKLLELAIEDRFGPTWYADLIVPHQINLSNVGILNPDLNDFTRRELSSRLFKYGYELGNTDFPSQLVGEILLSVKSDDFLHPDLRRRKRLRIAVANLKEIIHDGIDKRRHPLIPLREDVPAVIQEGLMYVDFPLPNPNHRL